MIAILPTDRKPIGVELWQVSGGDPFREIEVRPQCNRHDQLDHINGRTCGRGSRRCPGWRKRLEESWPEGEDLRSSERVDEAVMENVVNASQM